MTTVHATALHLNPEQLADKNNARLKDVTDTGTQASFLPFCPGGIIQYTDRTPQKPTMDF